MLYFIRFILTEKWVGCKHFKSYIFEVFADKHGQVAGDSMTHSRRSSSGSRLLMKALSIYCIIVPLKLLFICMDFVRLIPKNTAKKWNVIPLLFSFTPFHQCGIVLCGVAIVSSSLLTKKSCGLLLKTGQVARRRNYEGLGELLDILRKQY